MAAPIFLFTKGNYAFADQNFKPSLLINKTIAIRNGKKQFLSVSYDCDKIRKYTVCFYHVTYAFQSESTLYSCLDAKELLARNRREI